MVGNSESIGNGAERPSWQPHETVRGTRWHTALLVVGVILGLGMGAAAAMLQSPVYQSTAQISIVKKNPDAVAGPHASATGDLAPPAEVLRSSQIIENVLRSPMFVSRGTATGADAE